MIKVEAKVTFGAKLNDDGVTCHESCTWYSVGPYVSTECLYDRMELDISNDNKPIARDECREAAREK